MGTTRYLGWGIAVETHSLILDARFPSKLYFGGVDLHLCLFLRAPGAPPLGSHPMASRDRITLGLAPIFAVLAMIARELAATTAAADALHQLQENCEKLAAETFRREPADEYRVAYRTHYNARLNKCFYEETYISPTRVGINMWVYLSDLQDNRIYGGFHISTTIGFFTAIFRTRSATRLPSGTGL